MVSVPNATLTITPVTLCLYIYFTLYGVSEKNMKTTSLVIKNEPTVETITKRVIFHGDSLVDPRLPVRVHFEPNEIVITDYSELGIYISSKMSTKPLEAPLLLALQLVSLYSDISQATSDNKSFREFISKITQ
jgi:hypothetical protein